VNLVLAAFVVVTFAALIERFGLVQRTREVSVRAADCVAVLRDPLLDEITKERTLQRHALRLFGLSGILLGGGVLALVVPLVGVWVLSRVGVVSFGGVLEMLTRFDFLAATAVIGLVVYVVVWLARRK